MESNKVIGLIFPVGGEAQAFLADRDRPYRDIRENELVDMIGREDNGEDFVVTGVGAGHYVGTCKKEPSKNKSVSEKTCNARESSGRLDADRNVDRNDIAKDKEVK